MPQSEGSWMTGPLIARNLRRALIKLEISMDSVTSMCTARVDIQANSTAQRLL